MSLPGVLLVIFVVLKCVGVIAWPWVVVLIPLWIGIVFFILVFVFGLTILGVASRRSLRSSW